MSEIAYQDHILNEMKLKSALNSRKIIFEGEVCSSNVLQAVYLLDKLVALDKRTGTKEDITILIHSFGGSILEGNYLISKLIELREKLNYNIIGIVGGYGMSMGFQTLQACSIRKCYSTSRLLFHQPSSYSYGDLESMERDNEEVNYLWEMSKSLVKARTLLTDKMMETWKKERRDKYFSNEELIKYNIVDEII
jgi:ATP-dependent protease ClpP protease subunit